MENLKWIFEGIGTELISLIVGLGIGGTAGYKIAIKKTGKQKQIAKDKVKQKQVMEFEGTVDAKEGEKRDVILRQSQKAGSNVEQCQIGKIKR